MLVELVYVRLAVEAPKKLGITASSRYALAGIQAAAQFFFFGGRRSPPPQDGKDCGAASILTVFFGGLFSR